MKYFIVDETYQKINHYWHCMIGGCVINCEDLVKIELEINQAIFDFRESSDDYNPYKEFKYTDFYRGLSDQDKVDLLKNIVEVIDKNNVEVIISHAKCEERKLIGISEDPQKEIQHLAYFNISRYLKHLTDKSVVQIVVDLGLSKGFKSIYDIYVGMNRGLHLIKSHGTKDENITIPNYRNLPVPLFVASNDSRILQFSDLVIGYELAKINSPVTEYKKKMLAVLKSLDNKITLNSIEWNKQQP